MNGRYALYCTKRASFGAHHENLNEDRPMLSATKIWPNDSKFLAICGLCGYSSGFSGRLPQTTVGMSTTAIFSAFGNFRDKASFIIAICSPSSAFIPKCMNGYFALNSIFPPARQASETATFENNCVKTNKDRPILPAAKMFYFLRGRCLCRYSRGFIGSLGTSNKKNLVFDMGFFSISVSVSSRVVTIIRRHCDRCYRSVICLSVGHTVNTANTVERNEIPFGRVTGAVLSKT